MEDLIIAATDDSPEVNFNSITGEIRISGRAYGSDMPSFFKRLANWVDEYIQNPSENTTLLLQLDYNNSVSSRLIFELILKCKKVLEKEKAFQIKWYHHEGDDDSIDYANLVSKLISYPIENIETE